MKDVTIGVIGVGVVGGALVKCFEKAKFPIVKYDTGKDIGSLADIVGFADIVFVSVPTPTRPDGLQDRTAIMSTLHRLAQLKYKGIVVIKSTIVPGTMDTYAAQFPELILCHNPEFLTEANADKDFMEQEAILLSGPDGWVTQKVIDAYSDALPDAFIACYDDYKVTESAKYLHNCFLATKVSFMNQFFDYCNMKGVNYADVVTAASSQAKLGSSHLMVPGPDGKRGFGGMCFPKDTSALLKDGPALSILREAIQYNRSVRNE